MTFWILIAIALFVVSAIVALCFGGGCNSEPSEYLDAKNMITKADINRIMGRKDNG